jgi:hypothetical protein
MTSDHRVTGSSPAGCKSSTRADSQPIMALGRWRQKKLVIGLLSGFWILLDLVSGDMRTNPRNLVGLRIRAFGGI